MQVKLQNRDEFEKLLAHYEPNKESIRVLNQIPLVILLGVTASGRNTIINHLVETGRYKFIVSDTTRPPKIRDGVLEQNGLNYYFRTEGEVLDDLKAGNFLEAELIHNQQVSGISIRELSEVAKSGKIPINEIDFGGTDNVLHAKPDTQFFFIVPPSYEVWMQRLNSREVMSPEELHNRLETAVRVIEKALSEDHFTFVINDDSTMSADRIDEQVRGTRDIGHHDEARMTTRRLLTDIKKEHDL